MGDQANLLERQKSTNTGQPEQVTTLAVNAPQTNRQAILLELINGEEYPASSPNPQAIPEQNITPSIQRQTQDQFIHNTTVSAELLARIASNRQAATTAAALYYSMKGGLTGIGTNEEQIFSLMKDKDPRQLALIRECYQEYYQRDLKADLHAELKSEPRYLRHVNCLLEGNPIESIVSSIRLEKVLPTQNFERLCDILASMDQETIGKVAELYLQKEGKDLISSLSEKFTAHQIEKLEIILRSDRVLLRAFEIGELISAKNLNFAPLVELLRRTDQETLRGVSEKLQLTEQRTPADLLSRIKDPLQREIIAAFLDNNKALAESLLIHKSLKEGTLTISGLRSSLEALNIEERKEMFVLYEKMNNRQLVSDLSAAFMKTPLGPETLNCFLAYGPAHEHSQILYHSLEMQRNPAQVNTLCTILSPKTLTELAELKSNLLSQHKLDLDAHLNKHLSGRELFETRIALSYKASSLEDELNLLRARYEFERQQRGKLPSLMLKNFSEQQKRIEKTLEEMEKLEKRASEMRQDDTEYLRFYRLLDFAELDLLAYRNAKTRFYSLLSDMVAVLAAYVAYRAGIDFGFTGPESGGAAAGLFFVTRLYLRSYSKVSDRHVRRSITRLQDKKRKALGSKNRSRISRKSKRNQP